MINIFESEEDCCIINLETLLKRGLGSSQRPTGDNPSCSRLEKNSDLKHRSCRFAVHSSPETSGFRAKSAPCRAYKARPFFVNAPRLPSTTCSDALGYRRRPL